MEATTSTTSTGHETAEFDLRFYITRERPFKFSSLLPSVSFAFSSPRWTLFGGHSPGLSSPSFGRPARRPLRPTMNRFVFASLAQLDRRPSFYLKSKSTSAGHKTVSFKVSARNGAQIAGCSAAAAAAAAAATASANTQYCLDGQQDGRQIKQTQTKLINHRRPTRASLLLVGGRKQTITGAYFVYQRGGRGASCGLAKSPLLPNCSLEPTIGQLASRAERHGRRPLAMEMIRCARLARAEVGQQTSLPRRCGGGGGESGVVGIVGGSLVWPSEM